MLHSEHCKFKLQFLDTPGLVNLVVAGKLVQWEHTFDQNNKIGSPQLLCLNIDEIIHNETAPKSKIIPPINNLLYVLSLLLLNQLLPLLGLTLHFLSFLRISVGVTGM